MKQIKVLITKKEIDQRLDELAEQLMKEYQGKEMVFLCTLKGSIFFAVELGMRIKNNIKFEFIEVSSYEGHDSTGIVKVNKDITGCVQGKNVVIIEDIVDTGRTLCFLKEYLLKKQPESLKICALLDKPSRRLAPVEADYIGFTIENKFVIGYGLDDEQNYRNLNYVGYIEE